MATDDRFFQGIETEVHATSAGPCELPILYRDASLLGVFYRVAMDDAAALLPADGPFEPFKIFGKALAAIFLFEYRETSIGPYGEIGLAIQVKRRGTKPGLLRFMRDMKGQEETGLYVVNLPVTEEGARAAGVELWGYPKYVNGIDTAFGETDCRITLADEFTLSARRGRGLRTKGLPFCTFTHSGGRILRTVVDVGHKVKWGGSRSVQLDILGEGPTSANLRALGLHERRPSYTFRTDALRAILPAGKDVGAWPGASGDVAASAAA